MNDWDQMVERMCEADGVRTASGHHIGTPTESSTTCGCWYGRYGNLVSPCDDHYDAGLRSEQYGPDPWVDRRDDDR